MLLFFLDDYTKITTPRQDVLFKKGWYLNRSRIGNPKQSTCNQTSETDYNLMSVPLCSPDIVSNGTYCHDMQFCATQAGYLNEGENTFLILSSLGARLQWPRENCNIL